MQISKVKKKYRPSYSKFFNISVDGPVKRFFSFGVMSIFGIGTLALVQMSTVNSNTLLVKTDTKVVAGEVFTIDIYVDVSDEVNAIDAEIAFSSDLLTITSLRTGESVLNIWTKEPKISNRLLTFSGGTFRRGFTGKHRVISLRAVADRPGVVNIEPKDVTFLIGDGSGTEVASQSIGLSPVTIEVLSVEKATKKGLYINHANGSGLRTDLTGDGKVTMSDISMFLVAWSNKYPVYDFTGDGRMTFRDFSVILSEYNKPN